MTKRFSIDVCFGALAFATTACSDDPERPPPYTATTPGDVQNCVTLRQRGELVGDEFSIDGKPAKCAVNGLVCALEPSAAVSARCDAGLTEATCVGASWRFRCARADSGA